MNLDRSVRRLLMFIVFVEAVCVLGLVMSITTGFTAGIVVASVCIPINVFNFASIARLR